MNRLLLAGLVALSLSGVASAKIHSWKGTVHLIAVPLIAGTGYYSSATMLRDASETGTKAAAISNMSLLSVQALLGGTILFTGDDLPPVVRTIHRVVGASVVASALWMSIAGSLDKGVQPASRYTAYAHTVLASAPLIIFTF